MGRHVYAVGGHDDGPHRGLEGSVGALTSVHRFDCFAPPHQLEHPHPYSAQLAPENARTELMWENVAEMAVPRVFPFSPS